MWVYVYVCKSMALYVYVSLYVYLYIYRYVCVYFIKEIHIPKVHKCDNEVSQSEHICEQHSNVTFTRSSFSILPACQPALLEAFAAIYQTLPNSPQI